MTSGFVSSFGGSVGNADDRGLYVILSASEISHNLSEQYMPCGKTPSREIAAPAARKDKTNRYPPI